MKIAYATLQDARDVRRGSGTPYYFHRELERQGHAVHLLGPLEVVPPPLTRLLARASRAFGWRYRSLQDPFVGRRIGRAASAAADGLPFDVLLTNDHGIAAYARAGRPVVLFTDAVFPADYRRVVNPRLTGLSPASVRCCQRVHRRGLARADLCVFPTQWAAGEALRYDPRLESKLRVIPFGANLEDPGGDVAASRRFARVEERGRLELLFVGKDWKGKGGDVAVAAVEALRRAGRDARLHLVGGGPAGEPVAGGVASGWLRSYGLLDKRRQDERARLDALYRTADLLILPTRGEGFGLAAVEAAAYGLPTVGYDTIGLNEAVRHLRTGVLLPPGSGAEAFAETIAGWFADPQEYDALARGARLHFERHANWTVAVRRLVNELAAVAGPPSPPPHP